MAGLSHDLNLSGQSLNTLSDLFTEEDAHLFADVTTLNLQFNNLRELPGTLPLVLPNLEVINLNNNPLEDLHAVADVLSGCPQLKSLFIALSVEDDLVRRLRVVDAARLLDHRGDLLFARGAHWHIPICSPASSRAQVSTHGASTVVPVTVRAGTTSLRGIGTLASAPSGQ